MRRLSILLERAMPRDPDQQHKRRQRRHTTAPQWLIFEVFSR
jgi:hypothetical protein